MKKYPALLLMLLTLLSGCGGNTVTAADAALTDIRDEIAAELAPGEAVNMTTDYILTAYGLDETDCRQCAAYMVSRGSFPDEIILVESASPEAEERIAAQLQLTLDNVLAQSQAYEPETYAALKDCGVYRDNGYVCLFMTAQVKEAEEIFLRHLREYEPGAAPVFTMAPVVTPEPKAEPTPEPVEEKLAYGLVPESEWADDSAFDGVIFVGNSVAGNLAEYVTKQRMGEDPTCMGGAVLYTAPRFSYRTAVAGLKTGQIFPNIGGKSYEVADAVAVAGADTVYLSMGFNDLANYPKDDVSVTVDYAARLIAAIREKNPDVTVCILSVTPRIAWHDHVGNYNNDRIRELNRAFLAWAEENECYYIDCFTPLSTEEGTLIPEAYREYGDTDGIHLNEYGCKLWLDWLYTHTIP